MRLSLSAAAIGVAFAALAQCDDALDIPGYEAIPRPAVDKYANEDADIAARSVGDLDTSIPAYLGGNYEPTHMPEEDLYPETLHARSVDENTDDQPHEYPDDFSLTPEEEAEVIRHLQARSVDQDSYDDYVDYHSARSVDEDVDPMEYHRFASRSVVPDDEDDYDETYPDYEDHTLNARSDMDTNGVIPDYDDDEDEPFHKRSEDADDVDYDSAHPGHDTDFDKRSLGEDLDVSQLDMEELYHLMARGLTPEEVPPYDGPMEGLDFDELKHLMEREAETDDYDDAGEDGDYGDYSSESEPVNTADDTESAASTASDESATPAATPTPAPADSATTPALTAASTWSDVQSETASVSSHLQARSATHHSRARYNRPHPKYTSTTKKDAPKKTRKGFFRLPWQTN